MPSFKEEFGGDTSMTITLNSLANGSARESTVVDNSSNKYVDALVRLHIKLATGTPASDKLINIYAYASEDGTNYGDNATGSDAAITLRSPTNLKLIGTIYTPDSGGLTYKGQPMSVATAFGGVLPPKWGIVVENRSGLALDTTNNALAYNGVYYTVN